MELESSREKGHRSMKPTSTIPQPQPTLLGKNMEGLGAHEREKAALSGEVWAVWSEISHPVFILPSSRGWEVQGQHLDLVRAGFQFMQSCTLTWQRVSSELFIPL